jgi:hypothetical protein
VAHPRVIGRNRPQFLALARQIALAQRLRFDQLRASAPLR